MGDGREDGGEPDDGEEVGPAVVEGGEVEGEAGYEG